MKSASLLLSTRPWLSLVLVQLLFVTATWPYLTGRYVFAPTAYAAERGFRADDRLGREIVPRDRFGAEDYLDQERIYLRFYRDSVRNGDFPFWNTRTFGGVSQEDSMIFSYLSPLNLVWLLINNDHVAKGLQIFLLLNLGALAVFWWCRILGVGSVWTIVAIILVTLTPLALHFQAHTHQPALYYCGMLLLAAFQRLIDRGGTRELWIFFLLSCLAVAFNFLSLLMFSCIALAVLGMTNLVLRSAQYRPVLGRIATAAVVFLLALGTMSFFLGPIILESHLVREPVTPGFRSLAPWSGWVAMLDSLSHFHFGEGVWIPFIAALPVLLVRRGLSPGHEAVSVAVVGLVVFLFFAVLVSCVDPFIKLFRLYFPSMQYSTNGVFRLLFFANLCAIPALMWMMQNAPKSDRRLTVYISLVLAAILAVNAGLFTAAELNGMTNQLPSKIGWLSTNMINRGLEGPAGFATLISIMFLILWLVRPGSDSVAGVSLALVIGFGYVGMYHFQRPNMPADLDPASHPIFQYVEKKSTVLTLEDCESKDRSWYRSETALAGFRSLDGPTDLGLFPQVRNFWSYWNDVSEYNKQGANLMEVLWVCSDRVLDGSGRMHPVFSALIRVLGVRYVFSDHVISDPAMRQRGETGRLRAYEISNRWEEISFIPGVSASAFESLLAGLATGRRDVMAELARVEKLRIPIVGKESGNHHWDIEIPRAARDRQGTLFMSHMNEYRRNLPIPVLDLPLESRWVLQDGESQREFPMRAVPFRLIDVKMANGSLHIRYSLSHYYLWLTLSLTAFVAFLAIQGTLRRHTAPSVQQGHPRHEQE